MVQLGAGLLLDAPTSEESNIYKKDLNAATKEHNERLFQTRKYIEAMRNRVHTLRLRESSAVSFKAKALSTASCEANST